jgi:hypothetical protein
VCTTVRWPARSTPAPKTCCALAADTIHLLHCVPTVPRNVMFVHASPLGHTQYAPAPLLMEDKQAMEAANEFVERVYCSRMDASGVSLPPPCSSDCCRAA